MTDKKKPHVQYVRGFTDGLQAMTERIRDHAVGVRMIHGAAVYVMADFHLQECADAARSIRFPKARKEAKTDG